MTCALLRRHRLLMGSAHGRQDALRRTNHRSHSSVRESQLGAYSEVGARTILLDVTMGDYSYVVNDAQITYTTIGKFCSIAAMTRINPGNHPMQRASQAHFTYRASAYFPRRKRRRRFLRMAARPPRPYRPRRLDRAWRDRAAGPQGRHRRGGRGRRDRDQGRACLHHRCGKSGADRSSGGFRKPSPTGWRAGMVGLGPREPCAAPCPISESSLSRISSRNTRLRAAAGPPTPNGEVQYRD